jgi:hypothetical protein
MDPVHTAQTIRMPASAEVCVDSLDRYNFATQGVIRPTTSSNWRTQLPNYVLNGYFTRLAVTQILFNWNLPTIVEDYNDTLYLVNVTQANPIILTIPSGWYTPNELATEIENLLQAEEPAANWTCTFNGYAFAITCDDDFEIQNSLGGTPSEDLELIRTYATLGFLYAENDTQGGVDSYVGGAPTMLPTRFIDIFSSYLTKFQDVKDATTALGTPSFVSVIARVYPTGLNNVKNVPIDGDSGIVDSPTVITMEYNTPKQIMWNPREALANFDIQLRDEFGTFIPWTQEIGCEYTLTLFASES